MIKRHKWKPIAGVITFIMLLSVALFFLSLFRVDLLIPEYLALVIAVVVLFAYVAGALLYYGTRKKASNFRRIRRIIGIAMSVLVTVGCLIGAVLLTRVNKAKESVTVQDTESAKAILGVYVKTDDSAQSLSDTAYYTFGVLIPGDELLNSNYALGVINNQLGTEVDARSYTGISDAAAAMLDGSVQALVVNQGFLSLLNDTETYKDFESQIRLLDQIEIPRSASLKNLKIYVGHEKVTEAILSEEAQQATASAAPAIPKKPNEKYGENDTLIFYLSGIDTREDTMINAHGDVNILLVFNATTRQILIVNTPRDFFVYNPALGGEDKLTHCAIQGINNSMAALEKLYGIQIDNYVRINFRGFERMIDGIGGITLDNPSAFRSTYGNYYYAQGEITLDGPSALYYARERQAFGDGDLARGRNQMRVIKAVIDKAKSDRASILLNYKELLDTMSGSFETDLTSDQISDLVKVFSSNISAWEVKSYSVVGVSGMRVTASGGSEPLYIIFPKYETVDFASDLFEMMEQNTVITDEKLAEAPVV